MNIPIYQVDAFANGVFTGNPAAICPLREWLPDATLQSIAAENNLAETAYFVRNGTGYNLRWFTPAVEVDLCGHATLASAYVLFNLLNEAGDSIAFHTKSGELRVKRDGDLLTLDFPARPPAPVEPCAGLIEALGTQPEAVLASREYMVVYRSEAEVKSVSPNFEALKNIDRFAVIITGPGTDSDFVSRFFAPAKGINEDPVTGSAHCTLIPYWANRLNKQKLSAKQVSARGGELQCELRGDRVSMSGRGVLYLKGEITI
jgi:PhzF family phenazine biosynthesis protein